MPLPARRRAAWRLHAGALTLAAAGAALPALATSLAGSTASSASSAGSASVGSLSDSVQGSSQSSARTVATADGDYRVLALADAPDHPGHLRLRLAPVTAGAPAVAPGVAAALVAARAEGEADAGELWLRVPRQALAGRTLAVGDVVLARQRPYGVAFAQPVAEGGERPFFLALRDDWQGELGARVLHP
jgi:hypothetical protein